MRQVGRRRRQSRLAAKSRNERLRSTEILDPIKGNPVGSGHMGEVVFTALTRRAIPLIRYRTGDLATWIDEPCLCGSSLRRMEWVQGRRREMIRLADGVALDLRCLDEAQFALPGVIDFHAALRRTDGGDHLHMTLFTSRADKQTAHRAASALARIPAGRLRPTPPWAWRPFRSKRDSERSMLPPSAKSSIIEDEFAPMERVCSPAGQDTGAETPPASRSVSWPT